MNGAFIDKHYSFPSNSMIFAVERDVNRVFTVFSRNKSCIFGVMGYYCESSRRREVLNAYRTLYRQSDGGIDEEFGVTTDAFERSGNRMRVMP